MMKYGNQSTGLNSGILGSFRIHPASMDAISAVSAENGSKQKKSPSTTSNPERQTIYSSRQTSSQHMASATTGKAQRDGKARLVYTSRKFYD